MKNTERFSNRVDNYTRYRPHYPEEIIPYLEKTIKLAKNWIVADIGSGTGISSELFLNAGNLVYGVEPNLKMREEAERNFKGNNRFISIDGSAESTSLQNQSVDLIVAGQAFHWFYNDQTKTEFHRIAKPSAQLLLFWNMRNMNSPFQREYEKLLLKFAINYEKVCQQQIDEDAIKKFFSPETFKTLSFPNVQHFDLIGLKGRLLSSSYAPTEGHVNFQPMMNMLEDLFKKYSMNGEIAFEYDCKLYFGPLDSTLSVIS